MNTNKAQIRCVIAYHADRTALVELVTGERYTVPLDAVFVGIAPQP